MQALVFEASTSTLYYSNDGRLRVVDDRDASPVEHAVVDVEHGDEVFRSRDRVKVDAFVAGYDLARELS